MNLEAAVTREMIDFACLGKPQDVCLVPERREEVTTEGGLDVIRYFDEVEAAVKQLKGEGIRVSLFIDADAAQIEAAAKTGATVIELFTYRGAPHSTSDDPSRYRPGDEHEKWPLGDPIERLKQHLIVLGEWSDEQQAEAEKDAVEQVRAAGKESEAIGTLGQSRPSVKTMFEEVYATEDWRLIEQRREVGV